MCGLSVKLVIGGAEEPWHLIATNYGPTTLGAAKWESLRRASVGQKFLFPPPADDSSNGTTVSSDPAFSPTTNGLQSRGSSAETQPSEAAAPQTQVAETLWTHAKDQRKSKPQMPVERRRSEQGDTPQHGRRLFQARHHMGPQHTLSSSLQLLSGVDPSLVLVVRRIAKLGFEASRRLRQHFASLGGVVLRILVAQSTVRQTSSDESPADAPMRRRPGSLGFVHMENVCGVQCVLAQGEEQYVDGVWIRVQRFEPRRKSIEEN